MRRALPLVFLLLAACAGPRAARLAPAPHDAFGDRLVERAETWLGEDGPFVVGDARYGADCSGFVQAVFAAEGIELRRLAGRSAPRETSGAAAIHRAARDYGVVFGGGGEWPRPGDLVFWSGTYDRDGHGDDRFTHVGLVQYVADGGTVVFIHRGSKGVVRGAMNLARPDEKAEGDLLLNSILRAKRGSRPSAFAGELFAGYGRIDPRKVPRDLARR
ncbi:MAG: NlpC/P60 family protein [Anaeromyxobacteraceae bacterium]